MSYTRKIANSKRIGLFTIGGGVPRNWAQQVAPFLEIANPRPPENPGFGWAVNGVNGPTCNGSFQARGAQRINLFYQELTAGMADQTPYRIGLSSEDLYRSFENENVCKLLLEKNSRQIILPLFGPPSVDSNLNLGYFNRMQKDHDCELVYFFYIP